ncbi:MAG: pentapeptide repeat-containing protein [Rickettsia endosymbiont of Ixodes persulcatus]|nr:pentapeptide repeat-containing protein [Rickettsia endosymbiont of Ixodes persulcatus]
MSEHECALKHIASVDFDMHSVMKPELNESIYFQAVYDLIIVLSQRGRHAFVSYYPELVRSAVFDVMDKLDSMDDERLASQVTHFITVVINAGFINFTGILFKRSKLDFSGTYLKCIDFSCVNLLNAVFDEAIFGCDFSNANLAGATFKNISLTDVKFAGANLINSSFEGSDLKKITFVNANLKEANFKNTTLANLDFKHASLLNSNFSSSNLKNIGFRKANLGSTSFEYTDLDNIDFREAHLEKTNFSLAELKEVYCLDAWLLDSNFEAAQFYFANFRRALLNRANFYDTEILERIDFTNAQLQAANLSGVDLSRLDLANADLTDANLTTTQRIELYKQGIVQSPAEIKSEIELFDSPANQTIEIADTGYRLGLQNFQHDFSI